MQRLTAILLLLLFLFNLAGYRLLFGYMKFQSDIKISKVIDTHQYDPQDLFTIAVDLNMPYQVEQTEFERVNGEIQLDGKAYKFVKRRITDGRLILVCVSDNAKTRLQRAEAEMSSVAQHPASNNKNNDNSTTTNSFVKLLMTDYDAEHSAKFESVYFARRSTPCLQNERVSSLLFVRSRTQPPDHVSC